MSYHAEVLADSISPAGHRLTTMLWTFPRFILAEVNTHKMISKSSASSRAIPVEKRIKAVRENPFVPESFGKNQRGMQAGEAIEEQDAARLAWLNGVHQSVNSALDLSELGVHKQLANRLLEPFSWHTAILSGTDWDNLFALRCHPDAQPEFRKIAEMARAERDASTPQMMYADEWHLPFVGPQYGDFRGNLGSLMWKGEGGTIKACEPAPVSAARCARVSYLTHDGVRSPDADLELYGRLVSSGHMSPLEHPARPMTEEELKMFETFAPVLDSRGNIIGREKIGSYLGNFNGFVQLRKTVPGERVFQPRSA